MSQFAHRHLVLLGFVFASASSWAMPLTVINTGFEDTGGQSENNEFTFGQPAGWDFYNPFNVIGRGGVFTGTLEPNGADFFNEPAPEGARVSLLFNSNHQGTGEYGYVQTLADSLQANTQYTLTVEVGNIASGNSETGQFFNLDGFPGYRVDLLVGNTVLASDDNSLSIAEGEFLLSTVSFTSGAADTGLGEALAIRLVNLNVIPDGFDESNSPDLEVDFDDVQLSADAAVSIPVPTSLMLFGFLALTFRRTVKVA